MSGATYYAPANHRKGATMLYTVRAYSLPTLLGLLVTSTAFAQGGDTDQDGVMDAEDNCASTFNPNQEDRDGDGVGDLCDNCPFIANQQQFDLDQDLIGEECDNCPADFNPSQDDQDGDLVGDVCDSSQGGVPAANMEISIVLNPPQPLPGDPFEINVSVTDPAPIRLIEIWVEDELLQTCLNTNICVFTTPPLGDDPEITAVGVRAVNVDSDFGVEGTLPNNLPPLDLADDDSDGVANIFDNCVSVANPLQQDQDQDGVGDGLSGQGDGCDQCNAFAACGFTPHVAASPEYVCDEVSSRVYPLQESGVFYHEVLYSAVSSDGCGCFNSDGAQYWDPTSGQAQIKGAVYVEQDSTLILPVMGTDFCRSTSDCAVVFDDVCEGPNSVREYYCAPNGVASTVISCPFGCFDGACDVDGDADGVVDRVDNCPTNENPSQDDWDNDGLGDECDCSDGFKGLNETGADCGGICGGTCGSCVPLIVSGDPADKIDIVFVQDVDYGGDTAQFLTDVDDLIRRGYFGSPEFSDNRCKFNIYYHPGQGDYSAVCAGWDLPETFDTDCTFADSIAIIFTDGGRACASGRTFSSPPGNARTVVHETGHSVFGSADEYCCDGGYFLSPGPFPNTFESEASCMANSQNPSGCFNYCPETNCTWTNEAACRTFAMDNGLDPSECSGTCSPNWGPWRGVDADGDGVRDIVKRCENGGDGWWKSDTNACYMQSGSQFDPDDAARVLDQLGSLPTCTNPGESIGRSISPSNAVQDAQSLVLNYNITGDDLTLLRAELVSNPPPNNFAQEGEYLVRTLGPKGEELGLVYLHDPREFSFSDHEESGPPENPPGGEFLGVQGIVMGDNVDFTVIVPVLEELDTIEVVDNRTSEVANKTDVTKAITDGLFVPGAPKSGCGGCQLGGAAWWPLMAGMALVRRRRRSPPVV